MERNKLNVAFGFGIFGVFFLSGIILLSTNFISRSLTFVVMSNMNYMTDIPVITDIICIKHCMFYCIGYSIDKEYLAVKRRMLIFIDLIYSFYYYILML